MHFPYGFRSGLSVSAMEWFHSRTSGGLDSGLPHRITIQISLSYVPESDGQSEYRQDREPDGSRASGTSSTRPEEDHKRHHERKQVTRGEKD
jgi:hypothetical protein